MPQHTSGFSEEHLVPATFRLSHKSIMRRSMTIAVAGATSSPHDSARAKQTQGPSGFEEATFLLFFLHAACLMCMRGHVRRAVYSQVIPTILIGSHSDSGTLFRRAKTVSPSRVGTVSDCSKLGPLGQGKSAMLRLAS